MEYFFDNYETTHHKFLQAIVVETLIYKDFFLR